MCVVSMISDWGSSRWPDNGGPSPIRIPPPSILPPSWPTPDEWAAFKDLLKQAADYDARTGQPDCEDSAKQEWMKAIEDRLAALEHPT